MAARAEDLLPALCKQVLTPNTNTSLPQVVMNHIVERVKEMPGRIVQDTRGVVDKFTNSLAENLESKKSNGGVVLAQESGSRVLGTSTKNVGSQSFLDSLWNWGIDALSFLLHHWLGSLAGLGALAIYFFIRF